MKIGILSLACQDAGGLFQYTISMLEAIKLISHNYDFVQIRYANFPKLLDKDIIIDNKKSFINLKIRRVIHTFTNISIGKIAPEVDVDFIISPIISLLPFHMKKPYIVTIHDFQQEYYPEFFTLKERISRRIVYKTGQKANIVVCESSYVKQDIIGFLRVPEKKIRVLQSPPPIYIRDTKINNNNLKVLKDKYQLTDKFLFYPAQFWYHKNHINLFRAIKQLRDKYKQDIILILTGSKKNNFEKLMREIHNLGLSKQVKYLGYVPNEDMPYLYKLSTALVMPTLFESVSIPIWEAFHLGCPVVSSNVCALPEQVGDAGLLFDPNNIEDMAEKIYKIWTDEDLRKELIQKGYERIKDLTLENYAKKWEQVIEETISSQ